MGSKSAYINSARVNFAKWWWSCYNQLAVPFLHYLIHTHFHPKNIPFTYLLAPKIHTFLSIKCIGASFLAQPNDYATVKENRMAKPIRLGEGVLFLRGKSFVLRHSKTF